jgi:hypothetical protein
MSGHVVEDLIGKSSKQNNGGWKFKAWEEDRIFAVEGPLFEFYVRDRGRLSAEK